jgi:Predicted membrane protein
MWKTYIYLPIGAILGSFISGLFIYLLILKQYVLVSSLGMGWYTYTSSFLLSTYGIEASFFGFLQNYLRELLTFFLIPFLSRYFKSYSLIAFGGATTMDNTLPVYILILGKQSTAACLINGIIITFAVPLILFITYFLNYFL